jgi:hypothetical protein
VHAVAVQVTSKSPTTEPAQAGFVNVARGFIRWAMRQKPSPPDLPPPQALIFLLLPSLDIRIIALVYSNQLDLRYTKESSRRGLFCKYKEVMLMSTHELMSITGEISA